MKEDIAAFKAVMDEYYKLGCEDYVDGMPTRFKYTSVKASQYGISTTTVRVVTTPTEESFTLKYVIEFSSSLPFFPPLY